MSSLPKHRMTPEEYLKYERAAEYKSEFYDGEVFAMAGASRNHNLIVANVVAELRTHLKKRPCQVYPSDMRVKITESGLYTYPDVVVVCDEPKFEDNEFDTLLNPTLVVEVLSKSTAGYDRGAKAQHYRKVSSLKDYLIVAQDLAHVEHYLRQPDGGWQIRDYDKLEDVIPLKSIEFELAVAEIYDKVAFPETAPSLREA
jgi:Uma2 family endonuclease